MNRKNIKKLKSSALILVSTLVLAACGTGPIDANSTGFWDRFIVYPLSQVIIWLSDLFGGNYGLGIIAFTIIMRIIMIPLMQYQTKSQNVMMEMQPELKELQTKYSSRDANTQEKFLEEQKKLYEKYDYKTWTTFLPLLIQMPIIMGLYQAISRTEVLKSGTFLWLSLDKADPYFILPILAALFTFLSTKLTMMGQPKNAQSGQMMTYIMPVMIGFMALTLPSALSLYWVISNAMSVLQTLLLNNPFKKRRDREEKEAKKRDFEKRYEKAKNPRKKRR